MSFFVGALRLIRGSMSAVQALITCMHNNGSGRSTTRPANKPTSAAQQQVPEEVVVQVAPETLPSTDDDDDDVFFL